MSNLYSPEERLQIMKRCRQRFDNHQDIMQYSRSLCYLIKISEYEEIGEQIERSGDKRFVNALDIIPELLDYKPEEMPKDEIRYWWGRDDIETRSSVIDSIINDLEKINN